MTKRPHRSLPRVGGPDAVDEARWADIEAAFFELAEGAPEEREARLEVLFPQDHAARQRVRDLLEANRRAPAEFLAGAGPPPLRAGGAPAPEVGSFVGDWRLAARLGEGGTGTVFVASRPTHPGGGLAAVKVLRAEVGSRGLERLHREREVLSQLDHPGIAKLLDAGVSEQGNPFLVVELIDGAPIDQWVEAAAAPLELRLMLAIDLCAAVEYLHQHLLAHLDLKPANVLVTRDGRLKVVDFGLAGVLGENRAEGAHWLTPRYASPEQFGRQPVTTASDVYSLGVVVYELVTGELPYALTPASDQREIERAICEAPALPASERLMARGGADSALGRRVRGDLDAILDRALQKEPRARYPSAAELGDDLGRFLRREAVRARRANASYRLRKALRRNWGTAVSLLALLLTLVSHNLLLRAERTRLLAAQAAEASARKDAEVATQFLVDLFRQAAPGGAAAQRLISPRELLDRGAESVPREFAAQPRLRSRIASTIGFVYCQLGEYNRGADLVATSLSRARAADPHDPLEVARLATDLALCRFSQGRYAEAVELASASLAVRELRLGGEHPDVARTLSARGVNLLGLGRLEAAERDLAQALRILEQSRGVESLPVAEVLNNLAEVHKAAGRPDAAEPLLRRSLAIKERSLLADDPQLAAALDNLAVLEIGRGRLDEAGSMLRRALGILERALGPDSPGLATTLNNLANLEDEAQHLVTAEALYRRVLAIRERASGEPHVGVGIARYNLAVNLVRQGRFVEGRSELAGALEAIEGAVGSDHYMAGYPLLALALEACRQAAVPPAAGRTEQRPRSPEAVALAARAAGLFERALGRDHPEVVDARARLAELESGCPPGSTK